MCTEPALFAKIMATFVCTEEQSNFLFGFSKNFMSTKSAFLTEKQIKARIMLMASNHKYNLSSTVLNAILKVNAV